MNKELCDAKIGLCIICLFLFLTACTSPIPPSLSPLPPGKAPLPTLSFPTAPTTLCQDATQLRLRPVIEGDILLKSPAIWDLSPTGSPQALTSGTWIPGQTELFVAFPKGQPLFPGEYVLTFHTDGEEIGNHTFAIADQKATLTEVNLYLTPSGPEMTRIPDGTRVFYIHYTYTAACTGGSLWVTVARKDEVLYSQQLALANEQGNGIVACYQEEGKVWDRGDYQAALTLMGEKPLTVDIKVGPQTGHAQCGPLFAAAALSPEGEPFRTQTQFEWYTQAIYLGAACKNLVTDTPWELHWYYEGAEVRHSSARWAGTAEGVVWDVLTGTTENPFLSAGGYSATLTLDDNISLSTTFQIIPYTPAATE